MRKKKIHAPKKNRKESHKKKEVPVFDFEPIFEALKGEHASGLYKRVESERKKKKHKFLRICSHRS